MSLSSKTVFVLDHSYWLRDPSGVKVEIDWSNSSNGGGPAGGGRGRGAPPAPFFHSFIPPVAKSLWTCGIETVLEYCRVVLDLFANERLVRLGLADGQGLSWLNTWDSVDQQNFAFISERLGTIGAPQLPPLPHAKAAVSTLLGMQVGIKAAIEALGQPSPQQMSWQGRSSLKAINKGRIICVTNLTSQSIGRGGSGSEDLEEYFTKMVEQHNRAIAPASDHLLPILDCEFILISLHPVGKQKFSSIMSRPMREISPVARALTHVVDAERIVETMIDLCVSHHDLVSTIVTGIPMKEEQNAQHSSNYDVKLWHPRMPNLSENHVLKWSSPITPKNTGVVINHCTSAVRITPVDVNGRPTTCLTSFLMNGRSVCLEILNKKQGKLTSHLLTSHGGEMWLHVVETARNVLEDPPSISEGVGGRVTDYRIPDFADLIRMNTLIPFPKNYYDHVPKPKEQARESGNPFVQRRRSSVDDSKKPKELAKDRLLRKTTYWPMTIGGSVIFPMAVHIESLLRLMPQDKMTDMDRNECDKCIWALMSVEARGEPPNSSGHHKKGKREDQWRLVYNELENFIRANQHSDNHKKVLECFLESRRADSKIDSRSENNRQKASDMEKALASLASFGTTTTPSVTTSSTDSPMSPPPAQSTGKVGSDSGKTRPSSFLALWSAKTEKKNLRVLTNTQLYSHLASKNADGDAPTAAGGGGNNSSRKSEATKA